MIDTIKIKILPKTLGLWLDIEELKSRLQPVDEKHWNEKHWNEKKPLGCIKNMYVFWNMGELKIEGSLAKYYNKNNIENFDWRYVKPAIILLSNELGLPLENGKISRIDVGVNIRLEHNVIYYLNELIFLEYFQRIYKNETSLRFENNSH